MAINRDRFYDDRETKPRVEREAFQQRRLQETVAQAYQHAPAARKLLDSVGLNPANFRSPEDLVKIPITRKTDLIEMQKANPPFGGLLMVPPQEVERIFISPGPIYEYQPSQLEWFVRSFFAAGFRKGDIVVNTFTYHMSPAGMLFHEGLRQCGATVVVMGTGNTDVLIQSMRDLKINGFLGTPTFLASVIKKAEELGFDFSRDFALKKTWFTGEMLTTSLRQVFENKYQLSTSQAYAVTEPGGAIAYECSAKSGLHLMDDYIVEIVDPRSGRTVAPGETGEIVVTPLHNRTWGLLRFGTGDLSSLVTDPCSCGRTTLKISGILGRAGDAVKVRGMFIVTKQAEQVINSFAPVARFQIQVDRHQERDNMVLRLELKEAIVDRQKLSADISQKFQDICRLKFDDVVYLAPGTLTEPHQTMQDLRKWN
jgi:phenylacetate-CoA ligase